jgi:hypothetical protein
MGFDSLQHIRNSRSTHREPSRLATFRLQGLITLLTVYSLESRAGFVSHRQHSWDSPFGGFLSHEVSEAFQPGRTHLPLARRFFCRKSVRPARRPPVSGFAPRRIALQPCGVLNRRSPAPPLGFAPAGFAREDLGRTSPTLLSHAWSDLSISRRLGLHLRVSIDLRFALPDHCPKAATGRGNPLGVLAPARS